MSSNYDLNNSYRCSWCRWRPSIPKSGAYITQLPPGSAATAISLALCILNNIFTDTEHDFCSSLINFDIPAPNSVWSIEGTVLNIELHMSVMFLNEIIWPITGTIYRPFAIWYPNGVQRRMNKGILRRWMSQCQLQRWRYIYIVTGVWNVFSRSHSCVRQAPDSWDTLTPH